MSTPTNERLRLAELAGLEILDTPPEDSFDRITREIAAIFNVPVATIAFIDAARQFYKSRVLPKDLNAIYPNVVPREASLCSRVVDRNEPIMIDDLANDPASREHPAFTELGLRFYSGTPLRTDSGQPVGSLCIMDRAPRHLSATEQALLRLIAESVMTEVKLRWASRRLMERSRRIEADLARARTVQQFLLPPGQIVCGSFSISQLYHPHDHLGGDFLDVLVRPDRSSVILLADVTGHGASAALLAAMAKVAFLRHAPLINSPGQLLEALNAELFNASPASQFMTALAAVLLPEQRRMLLSCAGHPRPLRIGHRQTELLRVDGNIPLLIEPAMTYREQSVVEFMPGQRILFYTDGATETVDADGQPLEAEGLARIALELSDVEGPAFVRGVFERIARYTDAPLKDDVALICVESHRAPA